MAENQGQLLKKEEQTEGLGKDPRRLYNIFAKALGRFHFLQAMGTEEQPRQGYLLITSELR